MSADKLAETIWETSRADEGTISAAGADIVTRAIRERFFVIDRDDLPDLEPERPGYSEYVHIGGEVHALKVSVELYDDAIRELVALREYRREHPWVDGDVDAIRPGDWVERINSYLDDRRVVDVDVTAGWLTLDICGSESVRLPIANYRVVSR